MEEHILEKVVQVEKESQEQLDREEKMSRERVEKARKDAETELVREESRLKDSLVNAVRDAKSLSENRIDETVKEARSKAEKIEKISNDLLRSIVMRHITRILPEGEDLS